MFQLIDFAQTEMGGDEEHSKITAHRFYLFPIRSSPIFSARKKTFSLHNMELCLALLASAGMKLVSKRFFCRKSSSFFEQRLERAREEGEE